LADIFQEVDEEVRRDRALEFWRRYGGWLLSGAVAIVVGTAGYSGWQQYDRSRREAASTRFEAAVADIRSDKAKALAALEAVAADAASPYPNLARLRIGQVKAEAGERDAAAAMFATASAGTNQPEMRDLAKLLSLVQRFDTAPPEELRAALMALSGADSPLRAPAQELLASLALRTGDVAAAREIWNGIVSDVATPPAMRQRAADMLAFLPGDKK